MNYIMVLNDGETFTNLEGCYIAAMPDDFDIEDMEEALDGVKYFGYPPEDKSEGYVVTVFDVVDGQPGHKRNAEMVRF